MNRVQSSRVTKPQTHRPSIYHNESQTSQAIPAQTQQINPTIPYNERHTYASRREFHDGSFTFLPPKRHEAIAQHRFLAPPPQPRVSGNTYQQPNGVPPHLQLQGRNTVPSTQLQINSFSPQQSHMGNSGYQQSHMGNNVYQQPNGAPLHTQTQEAVTVPYLPPQPSGLPPPKSHMVGNTNQQPNNVPPHLQSQGHIAVPSSQLQTNNFSPWQSHMGKDIYQQPDGARPHTQTRENVAVPCPPPQPNGLSAPDQTRSDDLSIEQQIQLYLPGASGDIGETSSAEQNNTFAGTGDMLPPPGYTAATATPNNTFAGTEYTLPPPGYTAATAATATPNNTFVGTEDMLPPPGYTAATATPNNTFAGTEYILPPPGYTAATTATPNNTFAGMEDILTQPGHTAATAEANDFSLDLSLGLMPDLNLSTHPHNDRTATDIQNEAHSSNDDNADNDTYDFDQFIQIPPDSVFYQ
ncbi:MAG: hypothetical protein Q9227_004631 [Pyrenula ochraceoflavens]